MEMMLQIMQDYSTLPPLDEMTLADIRMFYGGCRHGLKRRTKPRKAGG